MGFDHPASLSGGVVPVRGVRRHGPVEPFSLQLPEDEAAAMAEAGED